MSSTRSRDSGQPQRRKLETVEEVIKQEKEALKQLVEEYNKLKETNVVEYDSNNEIEVLNAQYRQLLAEKEVEEMYIKSNKPPFRLPNDTDFLFGLAKSSLEKDVELLENTVAQQNEMIEKSKNELQALESGKAAGDSSQINETAKLELQKHLHKRLAGKLKKLIKAHFSSPSENGIDSNSKINNHPEVHVAKDLLELLKEFLTELSGSCEFDLFNQHTMELIEENMDPFLKKNLLLLFDCDLIEVEKMEGSIFVTLKNT